MSLSHQPCPDCGSSDALLINEDGSTKCYSCGKYTPGKVYEEKSLNLKVRGKNDTELEFLKGQAKSIDSRRIKKETCVKYKYMTGTYNGREVQIATYRDLDNNPVFQKIRYSEEKEFFTIGKFKPILYGMHLFKGNTKKLIITEGEIDALSTYQAVGDYPVVSIPNGAQNAKTAIQYNLEWIERFEEVVIMFDSDRYGMEAAKECAEIISIGKAKIVTLPLKDANEMLKSGLENELYKATWNGAEYRPDGIVYGQELWEAVNKSVERGLSYPFEALTQITYGIRIPEFICLSAGTGMGKTDFFKEIETHLIKEHKQTVGIIHLEETTKETVLGLMTKSSGIKFHLPGIEYTKEEKRKAFDETVGTNRVYIYDSYGTSDLETVKRTIRYMVKGKGCKYIFLDHITALGDGIESSKEVNQRMRNIVSELARLTRELDFTLFAISHLRKSEGNRVHEEGARVHLDDLYGAKAISQWASYVFALERNQQADNLEERHTPTLRCLKDRYTGQATGCTIAIKYDVQTGKLIQADKDIHMFDINEETGEF